MLTRREVARLVQSTKRVTSVKSIKQQLSICNGFLYKKKKKTSSNMPHLALIYNIEALEVFEISSVISRELRWLPMGKKV